MLDYSVNWGETMYLHYFNLQEEPFNMTPDPRFLFLSQQHESAIESLLYGIQERKGFITLTGEVGTGKTTICRALIHRLDSSEIEIAVILNPILSVPALLKAINKDFGNRIRGNSAEAQLEGLHRFLINRVTKNNNAVVLIDEAQHLSIEALEMIRLLSNLETDKQKLLQIILVGQQELDDKLNNYCLRQLAQRISIRIHLDKLDLEDTRNYIFHRLSIAGGEGHINFENNALKKIYRYTKGHPRLINALCDRSLLEAYARRHRTIDKSIINVSVTDLNGNRTKPWWQRIF